MTTETYRASHYADWAPELASLGYDCTHLTREQMTTVGMAAERAANAEESIGSAVCAEFDEIERAKL